MFSGLNSSINILPIMQLVGFEMKNLLVWLGFLHTFMDNLKSGFVTRISKTEGFCCFHFHGEFYSGL
jgi:hypothetical protein